MDTPPLSVTELRQHNAHRVLIELWRHGTLTRAELAMRVGVTRPAITRITQELIKSGHLAQETARHAPVGPGRPVTLLTLAVKNQLCIGADLRLDRGLIRATDLRGELLLEQPFRPESFAPDLFVADLATTIEAMQSSLGLPLRGIGLTLPIALDEQHRLASAPRFGWDREPIGDALARALGVPTASVQLGDIAAAAALANWRETAGNPGESLAHLQLGIGAGLAVVSRGMGSPTIDSLAIGHLPFEPAGALCSCGRQGCLDAILGFYAFTDLAGERVRPVATGIDMRDVGLRVAHRASLGDEQALTAIEQVASRLARITSIATSLLRPHHLTLGGYPLHLGDRFHAAFDAELARLAPMTPSQMLYTRWGDDASTQGAVLLATRAALEVARQGSSHVVTAGGSQ